MRKRLTMVAAAGALLLALVPSVSVSAAAPRVVSNEAGRVTAAEAAAVRTYWTKARMARAKPYPLPRASGNPGTEASAAPTGRPGAVAGKPPKGSAAASSRLPRSVRAQRVAPQINNYSYPFPFTRYFVPTILYPGNYPYTTIGKLFFQQRHRITGVVGNYVCSASSVPTSAATARIRRPVLWTAGHCLSNGSTNPATRAFSTNVIFVPNYENGAQPYGRFVCGTLYVATAWHVGYDFTRDLGACAIGPNALGQSLPSRVGTLGFAWNQSRLQHWSQFGYPAAAPFNGQWMVVCESSHAVDDTAIAGSGPDPIGVGCDMTGGSSGGPWVMRWKNQSPPTPVAGGGFVNGHNDYKYINPARPLAMYSPYFDTLANQIRCAAATGAATPTC
jgi:hypothetical protein